MRWDEKHHSWVFSPSEIVRTHGRQNDRDTVAEQAINIVEMMADGASPLEIYFAKQSRNSYAMGALQNSFGDRMRGGSYNCPHSSFKQNFTNTSTKYKCVDCGGEFEIGDGEKPGTYNIYELVVENSIFLDQQKARLAKLGIHVD